MGSPFAPQPPPPPPPPIPTQVRQRRHPALVALGISAAAFLFVFVAISAIVATSNPRTPTSSVPPTSPAQILAAQIRSNLGPGNRGLERLTSVKLDKDSLAVVWTINASDHLRDGARSDTVAILRAYRASGAKVKTITLQGTAAMVDAYGNQAESPVVNLLYTPKRVAKIKFDTVDPALIWTIADFASVEPGFHDR